LGREPTDSEIYDHLFGKIRDGSTKDPVIIENTRRKCGSSCRAAVTHYRYEGD